jgi:hypothetical protein
VLPCSWKNWIDDDYYDDYDYDDEDVTFQCEIGRACLGDGENELSFATPRQIGELPLLNGIYKIKK